MKRIGIPLFSLFACLAAKAQSDSLLTVLMTAAPDTNCLTEIAGFPMNWSGRRTAERALAALRHHLHGLEQSHDPVVRERVEHARPYALFLEGSLHGMESDFARAAALFNQAGRTAAELHDTAALVRYEEHLSALYRQIGDTASAVVHGNRGTDLALSIGDSATAFTILHDLARFDQDVVRMEQVLRLADQWGTDGPMGFQYLWWRGWVLTAHGRHDEAIHDLLRSDTLLAHSQPDSRWLNHWTLGEAYRGAGRTQEAIGAFSRCMDEATARGGAGGWEAGCACDLGMEYVRIGDDVQAEQAFRRSIDIARSTKHLEYELSALDRLKDLLTRQHRAAEALEVTRQWLVLRDSTERMDATKDLMRSEFAAEQRADSLLSAQQQAATNYRLERERNNRNLILAAGAVGIVFGYISYRQRRRTQKALRRSDELLLNILPEEVAEELKAKGEAEAVQLDQVTVLFTDFKGFTAMSEQVTPRQLVHDLHECFSAFDRICAQHGIEKIKTIGDAYMAAGGLPTPNSTHAVDVVRAALAMRDFIAEGKVLKIAKGLPYFEIRIGIHTGPVVAGIVGVKKFQYDIWGDTVNIASRMESSGEVGQVNISAATYAGVKEVSGPSSAPAFRFTARGHVHAKGKGDLEMYFVDRHPSLSHA
jgi:class 3 adenylate cyclase